MKEFVDFLGSHSPYNQLAIEDLELLAGTVEVEFFPQGHEIIKYGAKGIDHIFIIRTGSVEVSDRGRVVDVLASGDTFGHVAVLSGLPAAMSVAAAEDTLCYRLPDPGGVVRDPTKLQFAHYSTLAARHRLIAAGGVTSRMDKQTSSYMKELLWCSPDHTVREVAENMTAGGFRSVLMWMGNALGIITDDDFRSKVATGKVALDAPAHLIASTPVYTMPAESTMWNTYLRMVRQGIHHMVITGSNGTPVGVVNVLDMAAADVKHPLVVRSAIAAASSLKELKEAAALLRPTIVELWDADVSSMQISAVVAAVVDSILLRILDLEDKTQLPGVEQSWLVTGSMARSEPLPGSDVDTAVVWRPAIPRLASDTASPMAASRVFVQDLESSGLQPCPEGANASSPLFNKSLVDWERSIDNWISRPDVPKYLVLAAVAADSRALNKPALGAFMKTYLVERAGENDRFLRSMIRSALSERPPVGFVRNRVIERLGDGKRSLNLKESGLRPITSLARALGLRAGDVGGSTFQRLERAEAAGMLTRNEMETLKSAFTLYHSLVTDQQVAALRRGSSPQLSITPERLDPLTRRHLRDGFRETAIIQERIANELAAQQR
ncbi:DUF294 nucleotidyltransferase-like domain-containing protein [Pseudarthrobacter sp. R1]|uniref:putative nucleotidyltransferase substrate binding domain-containing protein n=1 Tax=Pseudarthrobacter sp. R1 TaxID=2944934 RepID=UPI00210A98AC|nr:putative nucleotidyltransferase substrate binding domain-containing protein [Pseudarthrobacter sp. R1]MCQ6272772.1 DUF294 nucleotidyltransferase-like domain-containing protein [Pseudarthrobacter sp. R1]